ncbi:hypothetical protein MMC18_002798 [Xylographa bjoerkii]|nr:hypothetical protein [Xylographa bjoerkii]
MLAISTTNLRSTPTKAHHAPIALSSASRTQPTKQPCPPPPPPPSTTLKASCACTHLSLTLSLPPSALPLPLHFCHCTTCRHASGLLCTSLLTISTKDHPIHIHGTPATYSPSPGLARYFCPTCGTHLYQARPSRDEIYLSSGALDPGAGIVATAGTHRFVGDAPDGGLAAWLPALAAAGDSAAASPSEAQPGDERLHCSCHCGGVQFTLRRPPPDGGFPPFTIQPENVAWPAPGGSGKYLAKLCACTSCRRSSGYDVSAWVYVPLEHLRQMSGEPMGFEVGTLRRYQSSEGVWRGFCGVCGANVFWRGEERRDVVDVSVGLLGDGVGSRAEGWVEWLKGVSYVEDAEGRGWVGELDRGLREARGQVEGLR